jgi:hypothetical protein
MGAFRYYTDTLDVVIEVHYLQPIVDGKITFTIHTGAMDNSSSEQVRARIIQF